MDEAELAEPLYLRGNLPYLPLFFGGIVLLVVPAVEASQALVALLEPLHALLVLLQLFLVLPAPHGDVTHLHRV